MIIIGERINSSRREIARAIRDRDAKFIQQEAMLQAKSGANYIDVNAGTFGEKEIECLQWLVSTVQEAIDKPLCIDSPNPKALAAALKLHRGKAIINSITGETARFNSTIPLVRERQCGVVTLCLDDSGMPDTAEGKLDVAIRLIESLTSEGVALEDIFVDPLVHPISVDFKNGEVVLDAIGLIRERYPEVHITCGISNVSFGLPLRKRLNQVFAILTMQKGLDAAIIDPLDRALMSSITATEALLGKDEYCMRYIAAYRQGNLS